jgi:hypothetical protein
MPRKKACDHAQGGDQSAPSAAQAIADQDRHVGGVEPGQGLADRQELDESDVVQPALAHHQAGAQVADHATPQAGGAHHQEDPEDPSQ